MSSNSNFLPITIKQERGGLIYSINDPLSFSGKFFTSYSNGQYETHQSYKNGLKDGEWSAWHENGQLEYSKTYKNGLKTGEWSVWHENGQLVFSETYKDGKKTGEWYSWYENGQEVSLDGEKKNRDFVDIIILIEDIFNEISTLDKTEDYTPNPLRFLPKGDDFWSGLVTVADLNKGTYEIRIRSEDRMLLFQCLNHDGGKFDRHCDRSDYPYIEIQTIHFSDITEYEIYEIYNKFHRVISNMKYRHNDDPDYDYYS